MESEGAAILSPDTLVELGDKFACIDCHKIHLATPLPAKRVVADGELLSTDDAGVKLILKTLPNRLKLAAVAPRTPNRIVAAANEALHPPPAPLKTMRDLQAQRIPQLQGKAHLRRRPRRKRQLCTPHYEEAKASPLLQTASIPQCTSCNSPLCRTQGRE